MAIRATTALLLVTILLILYVKLGYNNIIYNRIEPAIEKLGTKVRIII